MNERELTITPIQTNHSSIYELLSEIREISRERKILIQVFDPNAVLSKEHLLFSFSQAFKACEQRKNIAKNLENEFLLRTGATRKITEAIKRVGAKTPKQILLAITTRNKKKIKKILEKLGAKKTKWIPPDEKTIAKLFELNENALKNYSAKQLLLEKIALLGLED